MRVNKTKTNKLLSLTKSLIPVVALSLTILSFGGRVSAATQTLNIELNFREATPQELSSLNANISQYQSYSPQPNSNPSGATDVSPSGWSTDPTSLTGHDGEAANAMVIVSDVPELTTDCSAQDNSTVNFSGNFDLIETSSGTPGIGDYGFAYTNNSVSSALAANFAHYNRGVSIPHNASISGPSFMPPASVASLSQGKLFIVVETWDDGPNGDEDQTLNKWHVWNVKVDISYDDEQGTCRISRVASYPGQGPADSTPGQETPAAPTNSNGTAALRDPTEESRVLAKTGSNLNLTLVLSLVAVVGGLGMKRVAGK